MGNLFDEFMKAAQEDPELKGKIKGITVINDDGMKNLFENPTKAMEDVKNSCDETSEKPADGIIHAIKGEGVENFINNYKDGDIDKLGAS